MKQSHILKKLLNVSERSFIIVDRHLTITDTSSGAEKFSEYPHEKIINKDIREAFPETIGLETIFQDIWDNQLTSFEIKGVCRDHGNYGSFYFDFYILGTNELSEVDREIIVCIEDTTEVMVMSQTLLQRANEAELLSNALAKSKEYIDKVVAAMADALIVTDHQGVIKTINNAAIRLFGYSRDELVDSSITILFKDAVQMELIHRKCLGMSFHNELANYYVNKEMQSNFNNVDVICISKDLEEILVSFSCAAVFDYRVDLENIFDKEYSFVYVGRNITEIKRKERELIKAKQDAEKAAAAKSFFLANMSHEIRTPMNGVLGMTELLMSTKLDKLQAEYVENIQLSGNLLLSLINQILDLSKLEQQKLELELTSFNLEECMEVIIELFALPAHSKGLEINVIFAEDVPVMLIGDEVRLKQILINLIGNAVKFTSSGEILVAIDRDRPFPEISSESSLESSLESPSENQSVHLKFSIIDTGIGIAPEDQSKLFQPFSQVDASTNRRFGGTGLGLAISKQLVYLMDGDIGVTSPVANGRGTNFWFRLPFVSAVSYAADRSTSLANQNILVIDANSNCRLAMGYYLSKFGAGFATAANYQDAIACLNAYANSGQAISLIVIDWQLTSLQNLPTAQAPAPQAPKPQDSISQDLVWQIRQNPHFAKLPFAIVLRSDCQQLASKAIASGFKAHIVKPLKGQRVLKSVLTALGTNRDKTKETAIAIGDDPNQLVHPVNAAIHQPLAGLTAFPNASAPLDSDLKNLRVLLAEDNIVNQKITMSYLSQIGCQADLAANGQQVLHLLANKTYDIILMDCQMPILDGYATTRAIRQLEADAVIIKPIIIIAMTANAFTEDRDRCLEAGMDDYLSKPIRKKQLQETLEYWMTQKQSL